MFFLDNFKVNKSLNMNSLHQMTQFDTKFEFFGGLNQRQ